MPLGEEAESREKGGRLAFGTGTGKREDKTKLRCLRGFNQHEVQGGLGSVDLALWAHQVGLEIVTCYLVHEAATVKYLFTPITFQNIFSNTLPAKSDRLGKYVFL